jgi:hypothetical protein
MIITLCTAIVLPRLFAQSPGRQNSVFPGLEADPQAVELVRRGRGGVYSWQDLTDIALWASGGEPRPTASAGVPGAEQSPGNQGGAAYREIIIAAAEELRRSPELPVDEKQRGEYVLTFMHK